MIVNLRRGREFRRLLSRIQSVASSEVGGYSQTLPLVTSMLPQAEKEGSCVRECFFHVRGTEPYLNYHQRHKTTLEMLATLMKALLNAWCLSADMNMAHRQIDRKTGRLTEEGREDEGRKWLPDRLTDFLDE